MIVLTGTKRVVEHLAIAPGGDVIAASGGREVEFWHLPSGDKWGRYERGIHFSSGPVAFHPTKPLCFAHAYDGIAVIETDTKKAHTSRPNSRVRYYAVGAWDLTPDGEAFVGFALNGLSCFRITPDGWKGEWTVPPGSQQQRRGVVVILPACRVGPDGSWFVCTEAEQDRRGWHWHPVRIVARSMKKGAVIGSVEIPHGTHPWPAVAPSGRRFAAFHAGRFWVWDADDLTAKPVEVKNGNRKHFTGIAFHPSGRYLAATSNDTTVKLFDTSSWEVAKTFTWEVGRVRAVAFSPDGSLAAAGSDDGRVVVWDVDV